METDTHTRPPTISRMTTIVVVLAALVAVLAAATSAFDSTPTEPTFGPIPPDAWDANNELDYSKVPMYVPVYGQDGEYAGYVPSALLAGPNPVPDGPLPVSSLDKSGTLLGHFWPEIGFVPLGEDPTDYERVTPSTFVVQEP